MLFHSFSEHIKSNKYFSKDQDILIAVSGGVDSMVLSHLMTTAGYNFKVAHINHNTREGESQRDADFVTSYFENSGIKVHHTSFEFSGLGNFHDEAHKFRYTYLQSLGSDLIMTAHHQNDNLETVLINILNGRSTDGIPPINGVFVRPLLPFSKQQILSYAADNGIPYVEDSSNLKNDYLRNYLRNNFLASINESYGITPKVTNLSKRLSDERRLLLNLVDADLQIESDGAKQSIHKVALRSKSPLFLSLALRNYGVNITQAENLLHALDKVGTLISTKDYKLLIDREAIIIEAHSVAPIRNEFSFNLDELPLQYSYQGQHVEISKTDKTPVFSKAETTQYVPIDLLQEKLVLRTWKQGDVFHPLGATGKQKLKKFFSDNKVDRYSKERTLLLCNADDIVMVIGHRTSQQYKVLDGHKSLLKIEQKLL